MTIINPVSNQPNVNFKGIAQNENGIPYHKSNTGLVTGCILGGVAALSHLNSGNSSELTKKFLESLGEKLPDDLVKTLDNKKKYAPVFAMIAAAMSIGCGIVIDKIRNKKVAESANVIATSKNMNDAFMKDGNIRTNEFGQPYHHSNTGSKLGPIAGAICGLTASGMALFTAKKASSKSIIGVLIDAASFALGGWGVGALYDKIVNGKAKDSATQIYGRSFKA